MCAMRGEGGANVLVTGGNPQRGPGGAVRSSNHERTQYAATVRRVSRASPSMASYEAMVQNGSAIPGLTSSSVATIQSQYNRALFTQVFGPRVQQSLNGTGTNPNTVITPALSNDLTALSILLQVKKILNTPPLILLINPSSMNTQYAKVSQFQERSRKGYIYQAWGEEQVKISFTFKIGAYVVGKSSPTQRAVSGVQRASRRDSASFQQLMTMLTIFQSGGYIQDTVSHSKANLMIGNIAIEYDQKTYVGHFDTFSFSESEEQQHGGLEFEMEFTAIRIFDHAESVVDVQAMNSPSNPFNTRTQGRGTVTNRGQNLAQFFTAPTVGGSNLPPQPWAGARVVTDQGVTTPTIVSRRRT